MKNITLFILILISLPILQSQSFFGDEPFSHTYSIVARDSSTGEMGVAVQSHWFSVGSIVSWGEAGVGVIATQSFVNPSFGPGGLELLKSGKTADEALKILIESDEGRDLRQLAILDADGNAAAHTGKNCIPFAGHIEGDNFSVQANMMKNETVPEAMQKAFTSSKGPLAERMIAALEAAENEGGDIRGKQSAALLVVNAEGTGKVWVDRAIDLRVDDHENPVAELKRILKVHRAYDHMNSGDLAIEKGDMELAVKEYKTAEKMFPDNLEMKYWHAVTLCENGMLEEALPMFAEIFSKNSDWKLLTPRLRNVGLLNVTDDEFKRIMETVK